MNKISNAVGATLAFWGFVATCFLAAWSYYVWQWVLFTVLSALLFWVMINQATKFIAKTAKGE